MSEFSSDHQGDSPDERITHEAEDLMRQRRFEDAAKRYRDLRQQSPTDLWAGLGYASALECAGEVDEASAVLEDEVRRHRASAPLHRFRYLFCVRREDLRGAATSQKALRNEVLHEGSDDQLAELYFNQGRYHEAQSELERLLRDGRLEDDEVKAQVVARVGACLRQNGEHELARERLLQALALDPSNHWTLSELAEAERGLGHLDQARVRYLEALKANPEDHWTRGHLAQLEYEAGNPKRAADLYEEILAAEPKASWARVELAQVVAESDPGRAEALSLEALESDPHNPWANAQLGNLARRAGRIEEARKHYQEALAGSPNAIWILHELTDICHQLKRLEEAYAHLEHARSLNPHHATTYGYFADLLRHQGRQAEALAHLAKAVDLDPDYTWAWRELAELRALAGNHAQAEEAYHRACEIEPDEAINDGLKAFLLHCQDRREAAIPWLERAVERQQDYLWAWRELANTHLIAARPAEAEAVLGRALKAVPDAAPLLGLLAEAQRRQGRRQEAMANIVRALAKAEEVPQLWAVRAELAAESEDFAGARRYAARALSLDDAPEYQALLSQILLAEGGAGPAARERQQQAGDIAQRLLKSDRPQAVAFELAAAVAERRGESAEARAICDRALLAHPDEPRLLLRRARLGVAAGETDATKRLDPLLQKTGNAARAGVPWRDLTQVLAMAREAVRARAAAFAWLATLPQTPADQARGWLAVAELEMGLGHAREAEQALTEALARDPQALPGLVLAAVLAEQRGDLKGAITYLERLDRLLTAGLTTVAKVDAEHKDKAAKAGAGPASTTDSPAKSAAAAKSPAAAGAEAKSADSESAEPANADDAKTDAKTAALAKTEPAKTAAPAPADAATKPEIKAKPEAVKTEAAVKSDLSAKSPAAKTDAPAKSDTAPRGPEPGLLRQLALLYERSGDLVQADATWARIRADHRATPGLVAEHACYLLRQKRVGANDAVVAEAIAHLAPGAAELPRLLREAALAAARAGGAAAGIKELLRHEAALGTANRVLLAELALTVGDSAQARRQLERARAEEPNNRSVRILLVRALIGTHQLREAESLARALWEEERGDEESATLVAECLAHRERHAEALATLDDAALPARANLDRALLAAVVAFEHLGLHHGLARLGRITGAERHPPLARLFAAAFPAAWLDPKAAEPVQVEDLFALPPFTNLAAILGAACAKQGRHDLAATLLVAVSRVAEGRGDVAGARRLRALAVPSLCRIGARGDAWGEAWKSRSVKALLRCFWP